MGSSRIPIVGGEILERINQQNHRPGEEAGYPELVLGDAVLEKEREVL